jgi:hypothetical protein
MIPQAIEQCGARLDFKRIFSAIDGELNSHGVSFR